MPTGTVTGQTLFWDNALSKWNVSNNLTNDGGSVGVGISAVGLQNKFHVNSISPLDSSGIFYVDV